MINNIILKKQLLLKIAFLKDEYRHDEDDDIILLETCDAFNNKFINNIDNYNNINNYDINDLQLIYGPLNDDCYVFLLGDNNYCIIRI